MCGGTDILKLLTYRERALKTKTFLEEEEILTSEDVKGDKVDLGVSVLAGLGGRHLDDLAGPVLS